MPTTHPSDYGLARAAILRDCLPTKGWVWFGPRLASPRAYKYWMTLITRDPTSTIPNTLLKRSIRPIGFAVPEATRLIDSGVGLIVVVSHQRRIGGDAPPIDATARRWSGYEFAIPWDQDPDPEWQGYK